MAWFGGVFLLVIRFGLCVVVGLTGLLCGFGGVSGGFLLGDLGLGFLGFNGGVSGGLCHSGFSWLIWCFLGGSVSRGVGIIQILLFRGGVLLSVG